MMPRPHGGGTLTNNFISRSKIVKDLFVLDIGKGQKKEIENIAFGIFGPLKGFLNEQDFVSVVKRGRLANDLPWTIPIVLDADVKLANKIKDSKQIALRTDGQIFGLMDIGDPFAFDKIESAKSVFQTDDHAHPGFQKFVSMKDTLIEGEVKVIVDDSNNSNSSISNSSSIYAAAAVAYYHFLRERIFTCALTSHCSFSDPVVLTRVSSRSAKPLQVPQQEPCPLRASSALST